MATTPLPNWAQFNMLAGMPGTGKSWFVDKEIISRRPFKNTLILLRPVDLQVSNEKGKAFYDYPYCPDIYKYAGGKVKLCSDDVNFNDLLEMVRQQYRNGILVIDEASRYKLTWKNPDNDRIEPIPPLLDILAQRRKYNIETYFTYHGVSLMPVQLMEYANHFILFHQTGAFRNKANVPDYEAIEAMRQRIKIQYDKGNRYYCECLKIG